MLHALLACETGGTAAQLAEGSGLTREQVANALQDLRAKGLVTRLNTVVASYAARFPGIRAFAGSASNGAYRFRRGSRWQRLT